MIFGIIMTKKVFRSELLPKTHLFLIPSYYVRAVTTLPVLVTLLPQFALPRAHDPQECPLILDLLDEA